MTYRIYARMQRAQPSRSYPAADRTGLKAHSKQLIPRDHPVLAICQITDRPLLRASLSQCPYIGFFDGLDFHTAIVPGKSARVARTVGQFSNVGVPKALLPPGTGTASTSLTKLGEVDAVLRSLALGLPRPPEP